MAETAGHCAMLRLEEADPDIFKRYDLVGLGLPSFYFREPANITRFFAKMSDQKNGERAKPFFFFVTHGGTPGATCYRVHHLAANRGLETVGFFQCLGVDTYPPFSGRRPLSAFGHPDKTDISNAKTFALSVINNARAYLNEASWTKPKIPNNIVSRLLAGLFGEKSLQFLMKQNVLPVKNIVTSKCTHCGLCVENCPMSAIGLSSYPIINEKDCIACYQCHRICPTGAIECDWRVFKLISGEYLRSLKNMFSED
jgi:NAD-dependent dihydropyrimidine dehydrogenase PreA subunit